MAVGDGSVGHGGDIFLLAGETLDQNGNGGSVMIEAGNANNTGGSAMGGGFLMSGGDSLANVVGNCDLSLFDCSGTPVNATVYHAVTRGCERVCADGTYSCSGMDVDNVTVAAIYAGCTQQCMGGKLQLTGGDAEVGSGGVVRIMGGSSIDSSGTGRGGDLHLEGGNSNSGYGGSVFITSGTSEATTTSGEVVIRTQNGGSEANSGAITMASGSSCAGDTGSLTLVSGTAVGGHGGDITVAVGHDSISTGYP